MQRTLDEGRQEGQRVLQDAREAAERYREQQQGQARAQADEMLERARNEIHSEREAALEQIRAQFAGLAVTAAERIIRRSLDENTHRDLIDEVLAEGETMGMIGDVVQQAEALKREGQRLEALSNAVAAEEQREEATQEMTELKAHLQRLLLSIYV